MDLEMDKNGKGQKWILCVLKDFYIKESAYYFPYSLNH